MKTRSDAADRNKGPILDVLARVLPPSGTVLEVASGSGQHAAFFARHLPHLVFWPTDPSPRALESIAAYRAEEKLPNLRAPMALDVLGAPALVAADAMLCINMLHIAPSEATPALFELGSRVLPAGAPLVTYGPYRFEGAFTAPSNEDFDRSLRERDPAWGVRDVSEVRSAAEVRGFHLEEIIPMPANNHTLVFRKHGAGG